MNGWLTQSKNMEKSLLKQLYPVVFLDIDGVLNSAIFFELNFKDKQSYETREDIALSMIDPKSVENLNSIIKQVSNVQIVISSTWRRGYTKEELNTFLRQKGLSKDILGCTPAYNFKYCVRGNEIKGWLESNRPMGFFRYIILDDDSDMLYEQRNNFLHIDSYAGLTPNHAYKSVRFLNRETNHL